MLTLTMTISEDYIDGLTKENLFDFKSECIGEDGYERKYHAIDIAGSIFT